MGERARERLRGGPGSSQAGGRRRGRACLCENLPVTGACVILVVSPTLIGAASEEPAVAMYELGALGSMEQMLEERMAAVNSSALSTYRICICSNSRTFTRSSSASAYRRGYGTDCMYV